ncbi:MAG: response regulator [Chloroflexi bacterium]|nr:MAG: response regulator [Chloroflexota bacterium]
MPKTLILIVEDDRPVRETLVEALELDGYSVVAVENGRQALQALGKRRPSAIVLDLMMPTMDGWEFRRLQREIHGEIPVLVVSATANPRLEEMHADAFLMKPFELEEFLVVLRGILRRNGGELAS